VCPEYLLLTRLVEVWGLCLTGENSAGINFLFKKILISLKKVKKKIKKSLHLKVLMIEDFVMLGVIALISY